MFRWLARAVRSLFDAGRAPVRARYDAAQTTGENRRHWANADSLSANGANTPSVRRTLRNRARYEYLNNCYAAGLPRTLANYVVGTGPRLQLATGEAESRRDAGRRALAREVEAKFHAWAREINLAAKLRTMLTARVVDGESFAPLRSNPALRSPVKFDIHVVEADRVEAPWINVQTSGPNADGIEYDPQTGRPARYYVLDDHPGDLSFAATLGGNWIPAASMIHFFRPTRPEQRRGVSELAPALPLFAQLRRWTLANLSAAEAAAALGAVLLESEVAAETTGDDEEVKAQDYTGVEIERGMMTTLPAGMKASQLEPKYPTAQYDIFKKQLLGEIGRVLEMPFNIVAANSADYNYASGRLDHQTFFRAIGVEHDYIEREVMDVLFEAWRREALLIPGFISDPAAVAGMAFSWMWPGAMDHADPVKNAKAAETRLKSGLTSYPAEFATDGLDWEEEQERQAAALGLSLVDYRARLRDALFPPAPTEAAPDSETADDEERDDATP